MIHREGYKTLASVAMVLIIINLAVWIPLPSGWIAWFVSGFSILVLAFVGWFFRLPNRPKPDAESKVIAPADGTVIAVDEWFVGEFFEEYRQRVSIFMSGGNVHVNWIPMTGFIRYHRYNPGLHLFARHPKSSDKNERSTVVIENPDGKQLMVRQIAGVMARRVITYPKAGTAVIQGGELGFIKFGSRVDLFFPKDARILVKPGVKTRGNDTIIAEWVNSGA